MWKDLSEEMLLEQGIEWREAIVTKNISEKKVSSQGNSKCIGLKEKWAWCVCGTVKTTCLVWGEQQ